MKVGALIREDAIGAWHVAEDAPVPGTLRVLKAEHAENDAARLVFLEEIRRIRTLDHAGLIKVLKDDQRAARPWMLTELIEGPTLEDWIGEHGPLEAADARALAGTVLEAFGYLEGRRQVHAAPVPSRIVRVGEQWKVMTFRDVRAWDELKNLKGKKHPDARFAPPERDKGTLARLTPQGHNAWHVGAILRFALGGGAPRTREGEILAVPDSLPDGLRESTRHLMDSAPDRRPQGGPAVLRALDSLGGGSSGAAAPFPTAPVRRSPRRRR